ncbi:GMT [Hepatospora eriocheir]|uniref:GDP-mannose transporter n=1 Tax=Hepatospora eriocheir TaxID=1081669 RepID=A0A1X0QBQ5_9MICR|nr:GMT [Hepatospora eriocheir]
MGIFNNLSAVTIFLLSSAITTLGNKFLVKNLNFHRHQLLIILQNIIIVSILVCYNFLVKNIINFKRFKKWCIITVFFSVMIVSNMKALSCFDVSIYTLYKNISIVFVAITEYAFFDRKLSPIGYLSFILIVGSSWTGKPLKKSELVGYLWMIINIFSTTAFVLLLKHIIDNESSRLECVFFTNCLSIPFLLILSYFIDDYNKPLNLTPFVYFLILFTSLTALITAFSTAWVLKLLTSTMFSIAGAINKVIVTAAGIVIFKEDLEFIKLISCCVATLSALLYYYDAVKYKRQS